MKQVEQVLKTIDSEIARKDVLEVACGCAEFSLAACKRANRVCCIDLVSFRMKFNPEEQSNLEFEIMDATQMRYKDESFDTVVLYNAAAHVEDVLPQVLMECRRVAKKDGSIYIISSVKLDRWVIREKLLPLLEEKGMCFSAEENKKLVYVRIEPWTIP